MTDWATVSSLATAGGTLVLAVATFYSVRTSNRAARSTERALQVGLRPVLFPSRPQDPNQKIRWGDNHWTSLPGGRAGVEQTEGVIYLTMSLRNVGSGIAVLHGWRVKPFQEFTASQMEEGLRELHRPDPSEFRRQTRDLYVPPTVESFWQGAIRRADDPDREGIATAIAAQRPINIDLLYSDQEGGQRTISRFLVSGYPSEAGTPQWHCGVVRHWYLDRPGPGKSPRSAASGGPEPNPTQGLQDDAGEVAGPGLLPPCPTTQRSD